MQILVQTVPYSQAKKSRYHRLTLLVILREPRFESFFFSFFNSSSRQHLLSMSLPTIFTLKDHYTQTRKMFRNNSFAALMANILGRAVECQFRQEITLSPKYPNASTTLSHEKQSQAEGFQRIPSPRRFIFTQIFFSAGNIFDSNTQEFVFCACAMKPAILRGFFRVFKL